MIVNHLTKETEKSPAIRCGILVEPGSGCNEGNCHKIEGEAWDGNMN
jgi:hypothetical protein